jgi:hypothetical protein
MTACVAACVPVTVNVTFPQQKLDDAASQIVDMSRRPAEAPAAGSPAGSPPGPAPKPGSRLERWLAPLSLREAAAEDSAVRVAPADRVAEPAARRRPAGARARVRG